MRFPRAVRFDICLYAGSASTVGTGNGKNSWIPKCHKKWTMVFNIALLIFFYCPDSRCFIQLINPPLSKNCTCRGDML
jgi:hypothetical protein